MSSDLSDLGCTSIIEMDIFEKEVMYQFKGSLTKLKMRNVMLKILCVNKKNCTFYVKVTPKVLLEEIPPCAVELLSKLVNRIANISDRISTSRAD